MMRPIACVLFVPLAACWWGDGIDGDGRIVEVEKQVEAFHAVELSDGLPAEIVPGPERVVLRLDSNLVELVRVDVESGVLRIEARDPHMGFNPTDGAVIEISSPTIDAITLSDGATARATTNAASISIELHDGAEIELTAEAATAVSLAAKDGSTATLEGEGAAVEIEATDGSTVESRMPAREVVITSHDGSEVSAHASESVIVDATDGSEIRIRGNPAHRDVETSDGSTVDFLE
jgi:hypothetical protein